MTDEFFWVQIAIRGDPISTFSFCTIERGIGHFYELNRIARIIRERSDADADCDVMRIFTLALSKDAEFVLGNA